MISGIGGFESKLSTIGRHLVASVSLDDVLNVDVRSIMTRGGKRSDLFRYPDSYPMALAIRG